ncbi:MAG TPA: DNA-binding protein [Bacillota bacterium]|nr:DNA-binding protein [Bacillota bacterium]
MKRISVLLIVFFASVTFAIPALANVNSTELIEKGKEFDGQVIGFTGEAIGDPMRRGDFLWLNVKDKDNALGIWVDKNNLPKIRYYGAYNYIGDTLNIQGTFHRSCIEHGGDMDIHATEVSVFQVGRQVKHPVQTYQYTWTVIMLFTAGVSYCLYRRGKGQKGEKKEG